MPNFTLNESPDLDKLRSIINDLSTNEEPSITFSYCYKNICFKIISLEEINQVLELDFLTYINENAKLQNDDCAIKLHKALLILFPLDLYWKKLIFGSSDEFDIVLAILLSYLTEYSFDHKKSIVVIKNINNFIKIADLAPIAENDIYHQFYLDDPLGVSIRENLVSYFDNIDAIATRYYFDKMPYSGNSNIFHLCDYHCCEIIYEKHLHQDKLNEKDENGCTPLHTAVKIGDNKKVWFLLQNGSDSTIQTHLNEYYFNLYNMKFTINGLMHAHLFYEYKQYEFYGNGKAMNFPFMMEMQRGPTCGLEAAAAAMNYQITKIHGSLECNLVNARRKINKSSSSKEITLRKMAKQHGSIVGEIFNANTLGIIIKKHHLLAAQILRHTNYTTFRDNIKKEIDEDNPILIPFCKAKDNYPDTRPKPINAHWAVIIGYARVNNQNRVLIAQYQTLYSFSMKDLFFSNSRINKKIPKLYWEKKIQSVEDNSSSNKCWDFTTKKPKNFDSFNWNLFRTSASNNLNKFSKRMIVIKPSKNIG